MRQFLVLSLVALLLIPVAGSAAKFRKAHTAREAVKKFSKYMKKKQFSKVSKVLSDDASVLYGDCTSIWSDECDYDRLRDLRSAVGRRLRRKALYRTSGKDEFSSYVNVDGERVNSYITNYRAVLAGKRGAKLVLRVTCDKRYTTRTHDLDNDWQYYTCTVSEVELK